MANGMLASDDANPEFVGARNPDAALTVRFYSRAVQDNWESSKQGRPIFRDVIYTEIMAAGNTLNIIDTPMREEHKRRFPLQWAAFNNAHGDDKQLIGTPITAWPILTKSQAEELKAMKFLTVENLAGASDAQLQEIGMVAGANPHVLRDRAKAYLDAAKGPAPIEHMATELYKRDQIIADMQKQIAALSQGQPINEPKARKTKKARDPLNPDLLAKYVEKFNRKPGGFATNDSIRRALFTAGMTVSEIGPKSDDDKV